MTSYTLANPFVATLFDWSDPATWLSRIVPNAGNADVNLGSVPTVRIGAGRSFAINSLSAGKLVLEGALAVASDAVLAGNPSSFSGSAGSLALQGGSLTSGSLAIGLQASLSGTGAVSVGNTLQLDGTLAADGGTLAVSARSLGLTGGILAARNGGALMLTANGPITGITGRVSLGAVGQTTGTDTISSFDPSTGQYVPLGQSLRSVTGVLTVNGAQTLALGNALSSSGSIVLTGGATLSAPLLTLSAAAGSVFGLSGAGTIAAPVVNDASITAQGRLVLTGAVTGRGALQISPGPARDTASILELGGPTAQAASFQTGLGLLQLDDPASFTGAVTVSRPLLRAGVPLDTRTTPASLTELDANQILLRGIAVSGITGIRYSNNRLQVSEGATSQTIAFSNPNLTATSFVLSDGADRGAPGSTLVTVVPLPSAPSVSFNGSRSLPAGVITNGNSFTLSGTATIGSGVTVSFGGQTTPAASYRPLDSDQAYTVSVTAPDLRPGLQSVAVSVTAANVAGPTATATTASIDLLPAPINNVTLANVGSFELRQLRDAGYNYGFTSNTQLVRLTNGTLYVGADTNRAVVQRLYRGLLLRAPDAAGLAGFVSALERGTGLQAIAATLLASPEYAAVSRNVFGTDGSNAAYVNRLYTSFLGRSPGGADAAGLTAALDNGYGRDLAAADFATSDEAKTHLAGFTANQFVVDPAGALITQLYVTAFGRNPDLPGLADYQRQLSAGLSAAEFAQSLASSPEFRGLHDNQNPDVFVGSLYRSGLGRAPETAYWTNQIAAGANPADLILGIGGSSEASARLSPGI